MDQVGFEPTSSRVVGEVTLSFTTSNFVAFRQIRAGRKIEQSSGTTVPRRFTDEVTLLRTIPAGPMGTIGSLPLAKQAAFRCRISPVAQSALFCRSNAYLRHTGSFCGGNTRHHHATNFSSILRYISMSLFLSFEHPHA